MRIAISHKTRLEYSADVVEGVMDARLGPLSDYHQRWERYDLRVRPTASVRRYTDGFGNTSHQITIPRPHRFVEVVSGGEVETFLVDPFALPKVRPRPLSPAERADYLNPSPLVARHPELDRIASPFRPNDPGGAFDAVQRLMKLIYDTFEYKQNVTSVTTLVPEVLACRTGVCQDFAHVLIGLCRAIGIPARYVSGYIVVSTQSQSQSLGDMSQSQSQGPGRGGGASHAWIEAYTPTHGWRGFDPTNNLVASLNHVKMAIGRDYSDVPPTRGSFRGSAEERLDVAVTAEQIG
ncbi:MAG TPA: transglutaminase family protein [Dehalococcoidia bacterium]|nr:transglutaminase family protein [Dehalococcoidia bacterium]